jgi:hypothetical protein
MVRGAGDNWHGRVADVAQVWRQHHVAMLMSYGEGLSRSLAEAAAAGRPIVATDVADCREIVRLVVSARAAASISPSGTRTPAGPNRPALSAGCRNGRTHLEAVFACAGARALQLRGDPWTVSVLQQLWFQVRALGGRNVAVPTFVVPF